MTSEEVTAKLDELTLRIERLESGQRGPYEKPQAPGDKHWPAWRYPPDGGEGRIFDSEKKVPKGWTDTPTPKAEAAA